MTLADKINMYFAGKLDAISLIRQLTGMFDPKQALDILALVCTITRHVQGDIDEETFRHVWKLPTEEEMMFEKELPLDYKAKSIEELKEELIKMTALEEELIQKLTDTEGPSIDEEGITIEADVTAITHDVCMLTTYLTYRIKQNEDEENKDL